MVYYAGGLLQDKEKRYSTGLLPERKKELDELLKNIKEDDNPVVILVTLKPKKDNSNNIYCKMVGLDFPMRADISSCSHNSHSMSMNDVFHNDFP